MLSWPSIPSGCEIEGYDGRCHDVKISSYNLLRMFIQGALQRCVVCIIKMLESRIGPVDS